jgi:hypothetical protein
VPVHTGLQAGNYFVVHRLIVAVDLDRLLHLDRNLGRQRDVARCPLAQIAAHGFGSEDAQDAAYGESESQR